MTLENASALCLCQRFYGVKIGFVLNQKWSITADQKAGPVGDWDDVLAHVFEPALA